MTLKNDRVPPKEPRPKPTKNKKVFLLKKKKKGQKNSLRLNKKIMVL
jgi:hypothetical protein